MEKKKYPNPHLFHIIINDPNYGVGIHYVGIVAQFEYASVHTHSRTAACRRRSRHVARRARRNLEPITHHVGDVLNGGELQRFVLGAVYVLVVSC